MDFKSLGPGSFCCWAQSSFGQIPLEYGERQLVTYCLAITNLICVSVLLLHSVNNPYRQSNAAYAYEYGLRALNPKLNVLIDVNDGKFYREITKSLISFPLNEKPQWSTFLDRHQVFPYFSKLFIWEVHGISSEREYSGALFYLTKYCELLPEAWLIDEPEGAYRRHRITGKLQLKPQRRLY